METLHGGGGVIQSIFLRTMDIPGRDEYFGPGGGTVSGQVAVSAMIHCPYLVTVAFDSR